MHCIKKIKEDLYWVGANDRRLAMFEGVYPVPNGVSYNSYLLLDGKTVVFDTVDKAVADRFFENIDFLLGSRPLDYLIVQHMEPDHSATMLRLLEKHPETTVVLNKKTLAMAKQFFEDLDIDERSLVVSEGDTLETGKHTFTFVNAPMVHWPEVMVTYDTTEHILFCADAFGTFGSLDGAIFADEVDFERDYLDEARRYYTNIVGKYGTQVQSLLKKASSLKIDMLCPLHGFVWRKNIGDYVDKYAHWSGYVPEKTGFMIAYASVYGNTENAAEILSSILRDRGYETAMFDVSVAHPSAVVAAAFKYSHLVFASPTYNAGVFVTMENVINDLAAHNIQNRTAAVIENGSWAATAGSIIREKLSKCRDMWILDKGVTIKSSLKRDGRAELEELADELIASIPMPIAKDAPAGAIDNTAMFKLSYGLFVLTASDGGRDNGCIINTVQMVTDSPKRISVTVNKSGLTHDMIKNTGVFAVSVLSEDAGFGIIEKYGFASGRDVNKFEGDEIRRSSNAVAVVTDGANAYMSAKVISETDCGTHTLFIAEVTEAETLTAAPSMTYSYYLDHVKPKPSIADEDKVGFVCKVCGYVYEGETLPADYICPLCKHGAEDFEPLPRK